MKISYNWLKWYLPQIPQPEELEQVFTFHICEVEEVVHNEKDTFFDIKVLPDRAGDLLSHLGVARELSGVLGIPFVDPTPSYKIPESEKTNLEIDIESLNCHRYMGRIMRNFKVGPSPTWVVEHLASIGERSINNIVDASNLVMYNCGQPTHAFDLKKLTGEKIIVCDAKKEEDFPVVGSENLVATIKEGDLCICDTEKVIALAGIKGGTNSGISIDAPYTTDLLIEVANFNPTRIRKTGQRLSLFSDARKRFENNVPLELAPYAMRELSALLLEMCPDAVFEDIIDIGQKEREKKQVSFTTNIINEKLGLSLTSADIAKILQNYQYGYLEENGNFVVHVPHWRQDISGIHDMVEEIGRVYGYDKITPQMPIFPKNQQHDEVYFSIQKVKQFLLSQGYSEVMNYTFCKKGDIQVAHGAKGKEFLRTNLSDGIKISYEMNRLNAPLLGMSEVKEFEIGNVFTKDGEQVHVVTINKKGITEMSLAEYIEEHQYDFQDVDLSATTPTTRVFVSWSEYPFITRDIAVWVDEDTQSEEVVIVIRAHIDAHVVRGPELFDQFTKEGKTSYAFRMVFQSYEKTLTDDEVNPVMETIYKALQKKGWEVR